MGRPRKTGLHLPRCVYQRHGAFWLVKNGKWERLGNELSSALAAYGRRIQGPAAGGMASLIRAALAVIASKGLAASTKKQYEAAGRMLEGAFAEFTPEQIRGKDIYKLKLGMVETPGMFNRCLSVLRQVFDHALKSELVDDNPAMAIRGYRIDGRDRLLTQPEFDAIYSQAGARLQCMMEIWRLTGQRVMDVVRIRQGDLQAEGIAFRQQKTGTKLIVEWTPDLEAAVARAKALNGNVRSLSLFSALQGKNRGSAPSHGAIWDQWSVACRKAGIEDAQMRDLRAVSGTAAKRQGKDPQALLGHTDAATTRIYLRDRETPIVKGPSFGRPIGQAKKDK